MQLTLKQAAELAGVNKTTLFRAIKKGTVSASRDARNGAWMIDAAELQRVYPVRATPDIAPIPADAPQRDATPEQALLQQEVQHLKLTVSHLKNERDYLRQRLDDETDERRRLTLLLHAPLQDAPDSTPPQRPPKLVYGMILLLIVLMAGVAAWYWYNANI